MPFKSTEIRWFSKEKHRLTEIFHQLPGSKMGVQEDERTDHYLRSNTVNTGIKIREGNHEFKVKTARDILLEYGHLEFWMKWSTDEKETILNAVDSDLLGDWVAIKKKRWKKTYQIDQHEKLKYVEKEWVEEGCGIEFTEINIPERTQNWYTLGLESFSQSNAEKDNLLSALHAFSFDKDELSDLPSYGYPEFIASL
jgi:hypothetical protein